MVCLMLQDQALLYITLACVADESLHKVLLTRACIHAILPASPRALLGNINVQLNTIAHLFCNVGSNLSAA